jgi:hypothetical protein
VRGVLASHRWRRRFLWALPVVVAAVAFAALVASLPRGSGIPDEEPSSAPPAGQEPVDLVPAQRPVPVTAETRREVNAVLTAFVRHAVRREDPAAAWELATPALRAGQTRAEWRRGDVPVFPFPAKVNEATGWQAVESFENDLLVTLVMHAPARTKRGAIAYQVELKRLGAGKSRRWLVDSFIPERVYVPPAAEKPGRDAAPQPSSVPKARLSAWWFVVPGALLSLIVLVPAGIAILSWRRGVRAEKAYRRRLLDDPERSAP